MKPDRPKKPDFTPGVQAGWYETGTSENVRQDVRKLNSLQAEGTLSPNDLTQRTPHA